jgi:hypothetical protein
MKDNFVVGAVSISPSVATISGRESVVKNIDIITTEPIGIREGGKFEKEISVDRSLYKDVDVLPAVFRVQYGVVAAEGLQKLEVPIAIKNLKGGFQAELTRKKALLYVKAASGRALSSDEYEAFVDLGKLDYSISNENKSIETVVKLNAALKASGESVAVMMQPSHIKVYVRKN